MKCEACSFKPPGWYKPRGGNGAVLGVCDAGSLAQCNGVFTTNTGTLTTAAPAVTITFTVGTSNFSKFFPRGMRFSTAIDDASVNDSIDRNVGFTGLRFQGTNYKLDANNTTTSAFALTSYHALSLVEIGELEPGGQNVFVDLSLIATGLDPARGFFTQAIMYGWSIRGGGAASSAVVP